MTMATLFGGLWTVVKTAATAIFAAIAKADPIVIAKAALFVGGTAFSAWLMFKSTKDKCHVYMDDSNKTAVNRGIDLDYANKNNRKNLHPLLKDVDREFRNKAKKHKIPKKDLEDMHRRTKASMEELRHSSDVLERDRLGVTLMDTDPEFAESLRKFKKDMEEMKAEEKHQKKQTRACRKIWDLPAYN